MARRKLLALVLAALLAAALALALLHRSHHHAPAWRGGIGTARQFQSVDPLATKAGAERYLLNHLWSIGTLTRPFTNPTTHAPLSNAVAICHLHRLGVANCLLLQMTHERSRWVHYVLTATHRVKVTRR